MLLLTHSQFQGQRQIPLRLSVKYFHEILPQLHLVLQNTWYFYMTFSLHNTNLCVYYKQDKHSVNFLNTFNKYFPLIKFFTNGWGEHCLHIF